MVNDQREVSGGGLSVSGHLEVSWSSGKIHGDQWLVSEWSLVV